MRRCTSPFEHGENKASVEKKPVTFFPPHFLSSQGFSFQIPRKFGWCLSCKIWNRFLTLPSRSQWFTSFTLTPDGMLRPTSQGKFLNRRGIFPSLCLSGPCTSIFLISLSISSSLTPCLGTLVVQIPDTRPIGEQSDQEKRQIHGLEDGGKEWKG